MQKTTFIKTPKIILNKNFPFESIDIFSKAKTKRTDMHSHKPYNIFHMLKCMYKMYIYGYTYIIPIFYAIFSAQWYENYVGGTKLKPKTS